MVASRSDVALIKGRKVRRWVAVSAGLDQPEVVDVDRERCLRGVQRLHVRNHLRNRGAIGQCGWERTAETHPARERVCLLNVRVACTRARARARNLNTHDEGLGGGRRVLRSESGSERNRIGVATAQVRKHGDTGTIPSAAPFGTITREVRRPFTGAGTIRHPGDGTRC